MSMLFRPTQTKGLSEKCKSRGSAAVTMNILLRRNNA